MSSNIAKIPLVHRGNDTNQSRFNQDVVGCLKSLRDVPWLSGELLAITIGTTPTRVTHNLGRTALGWVVAGKTTVSDIIEVAAPSGDPSDPSKYLYLQAVAAVTAKILVF